MAMSEEERLFLKKLDILVEEDKSGFLEHMLLSMTLPRKGEEAHMSTFSGVLFKEGYEGIVKRTFAHRIPNDFVDDIRNYKGHIFYRVLDCLDLAINDRYVSIGGFVSTNEGLKYEQKEMVPINSLYDDWVLSPRISAEFFIRLTIGTDNIVN